MLASLARYGVEGRRALQYIEQHRTRLSFHDQPTGARWTLDRRIELHPSYAAAAPDDLLAASLVIHEVRHLQQGLWTALSVYGEMEAWQLQFGFINTALGRYHADPLRDAILGQIMAEPLGWDRSVLQRVRLLMRRYAGEKYRIDLLPLYPFPREIWFRCTGRQPAS